MTPAAPQLEAGVTGTSTGAAGGGIITRRWYRSPR